MNGGGGIADLFLATLNIASCSGDSSQAGSVAWHRRPAPWPGSGSRRNRPPAARRTGRARASSRCRGSAGRLGFAARSSAAAVADVGEFEPGMLAAAWQGMTLPLGSRSGCATPAAHAGLRPLRRSSRGSHSRSRDGPCRSRRARSTISVAASSCSRVGIRAARFSAPSRNTGRAPPRAGGRRAPAPARSSPRAGRGSAGARRR